MGITTKKRCVIWGAAPVFPQVKELLHPEDYIVAADGGWQSAKDMGITPDCILGDFDSSPCPQTENVIVLPKEKDDTDTHYATKLAISKGFSNILYLGVLGGNRLDHTFGAIQSAVFAKNNGATVELCDEFCKVYIMQGEEKIVLPTKKNHYFSLVAWNGEISNLSIKGAKYCLENANLKPDYPLGISNEFLDNPVEITLQKGIALLFITPKE